MMHSTKQRGFTLMELLIAIVIVAILAAIAIPTYFHYTKKAYYSEVVQMADRYKVAIAACIEQQGATTNCDAGSFSIPPAVTAPVGQVGSVAVTGGKVTVTPVASHGIVAADTFVLTPTPGADAITWAVTGGGCTAGLIPNC